MEHELLEPLHEVFEQLVFLQLDVLQYAYVLLMASETEVLAHKGFRYIPESVHGILRKIVEPRKNLAV